MTDKNKKALQILSLLTIIALTVINVFYNEPLITDKFSIVGIQQKNETLSTLNLKVKQTEKDIETNIDDLDKINQENINIRKRVEELKSQINTEDLVLHIPSILITLEQNANKNNVELIFEYNKIKTTNSESTSVVPTEQPTEQTTSESTTDKIDVETTQEDKENNKDIKIEPKEPVEPVEPTQPIEVEPVEPTTESANNIDTILNSVKIPEIEDINVTTIPLTIKGEYSNVREFIKFLDTISYLEPSYINLKSDGSTIEGIILINVFHGEVF